MSTPFLLCLAPERVLDIVAQLDKYQKSRHRKHLAKINYLCEEPEVTINAPDYEELEAMALSKEQRSAPSGERYHEVK